ncbi:MAG: maleylpyruvate isomerase family mycothiol-dependent enzyme [Actinomycetales bacterium]
MSPPDSGADTRQANAAPSPSARVGEAPNTRLSAGHYRGCIAADVARIVTLLEADTARLDLPVPTCPEWRMRDLVRHLGQVHRRVESAIATGEPPRGVDSGPPHDRDLVNWLESGAAALLRRLDGDTATAAWSFDPENRTLGFWLRRQAMENVVHRADAELTLGMTPTISPELAADAVSEVVDTMMRLRLNEGRLELPDYSITLISDDSAHQWHLGAGAHAGTASGTGTQLVLSLWKRADPAVLIVSGDRPRVVDLLSRALTP